MIAYCGTTYCNWHDPMVTQGTTTRRPAQVTIGQLEATPNGV